MIVTQRGREAETQAEGEAGSMHREPDVGFDPGSPGSPWAKGRRQTAAPPRDPEIFILKFEGQIRISQAKYGIESTHDRETRTRTCFLVETYHVCSH